MQEHKGEATDVDDAEVQVEYPMVCFVVNVDFPEHAAVLTNEAHFKKLVAAFPSHPKVGVIINPKWDEKQPQATSAAGTSRAFFKLLESTVGTDVSITMYEKKSLQDFITWGHIDRPIIIWPVHYEPMGFQDLPQPNEAPTIYFLPTHAANGISMLPTVWQPLWLPAIRDSIHVALWTPSVLRLDWNELVRSNKYATDKKAILIRRAMCNTAEVKEVKDADSLFLALERGKVGQFLEGAASYLRTRTEGKGDQNGPLNLLDSQTKDMYDAVQYLYVLFGGSGYLFSKSRLETRREVLVRALKQFSPIRAATSVGIMTVRERNLWQQLQSHLAAWDKCEKEAKLAHTLYVEEELYVTENAIVAAGFPYAALVYPEPRNWTLRLAEKDFPAWLQHLNKLDAKTAVGNTTTPTIAKNKGHRTLSDRMAPLSDWMAPLSDRMDANAGVAVMTFLFVVVALWSNWAWIA